MAEKDTLEASMWADLPKEIRETRKKLWAKLRQARMDGKIVFFSRPEPDKLFINGVHVPLEVESSTGG